MRYVFIFVLLFTFSDAQTLECNVSYINETHSTISKLLLLKYPHLKSEYFLTKTSMERTL